MKSKKNSSSVVYTVCKFSVVMLMLVMGCTRDAEYPLPAPQGPLAPPVIIEFPITNFNNDGSGFNLGNFWTYSDGAELNMPQTGIYLSPGKIAPDSSFRLSGTDANSSYWMGGFGHNAIPTFGLPNTPDKVYFNMDTYASNSTTNVEAYLAEDDGDVFKHALVAGSTPIGAWTTQSFLVSDFTLDVGQSTGNGVMDDLSHLGKIQFTLLSGGGAGQTADLYIDNIIFTSGGPK